MIKEIEIPSMRGHFIPALVSEPRGETNGTVVMAHGIFTDKQENGRYAKQAEIHHSLGRRTLRFDWQGHGDHPLAFSDSSVVGNIDDLHTVLNHVRSAWSGDVFVVASSFGAAIFLLHQLLGCDHDIRRALLLNPVTDFTRTFRAPRTGELAEPFSEATWKKVFTKGEAELLPGKVLGMRMGIELLTMAPYLGFAHLQPQTMVIHGSDDVSVPHDVTKDHALVSDKVVFETIEGADHAFAAPWEEAASFSLIKRWFTE